MTPSLPVSSRPVSLSLRPPIGGVLPRREVHRAGHPEFRRLRDPRLFRTANARRAGRENHDVVTALAIHSSDGPGDSAQSQSLADVDG